MNWGLPIEPISIPHFKNNTGKRLVRTVCITGNDIDITPNTGEAVTLVIKRQGVRAKMRTPCVYLVYCTCVKTAFNQTNSDANWTPQRTPSSNALRSCSVTDSVPEGAFRDIPNIVDITSQPLEA